MGFLGSIKQVTANSKNFKKWEQEQADKEAQRKALTAQKPPSAQELEKAKAKGKVIIDAVNIMDAHSEEVAEKTETATQVPQALIPYAAFMGSTFLSGKVIIPKINENIYKFKNDLLYSESAKNAADIIAKYGRANDIDDLRLTITHNFLDKDFIEKIKNIDVKDVEVKKALSVANDVFEKFKNSSKTHMKKTGLAVAIPFVALATSFIASTIWATKLQVGSSRVARYQSRQMLKDPKYFVQYNQQQIDEATKIVEQKEQEEGKKGFFKKLKKSEKASLIKVIKDNKAYQKSKKTDTDETKKVNRELKGDDLKEALKDREVIQRITKIINNKAEDYSENMEVAADTLILGTPVLSMGISAGISAILNKFKVLDKFTENVNKDYIKTLDEESAKLVQDSFDKLKNCKGKKSLALTGEHIMNIIGSTPKDAIKGDVLQRLKKGYTIAMSTAKGRTIALSLVSGIVTSIAGAIIGLKLQKASARAGRYLAKKELEQNPENFIGYTNEDLKAYENVKAKPKSAGQKFKEYITFLPNVKKQYFEYQNYRKNDLVKEKAIKDELVKMEVSQEQLKEAKDMQRKLLNTFEKIDDKSQEYSESIEAAGEIAKPAVLIGGILTAVSPLIYIGIQAIRGKISASKITNKITEFLGEHTKFMHGKIANKYLDEVGENITKLASKEFSETSNFEYKLYKQLGEFGLSKESLKEIKFDDLKSLLNSYCKSANVTPKGKIQEIRSFVENSNSLELEKAIRKLPIPRSLEIYLKSFSKEEALIALNNVEKLIDNIPKEKLNEILDILGKEFDKDPLKLIKALGSKGALKELFLTKGIKITGATLSALWATLSLGATFAIESYLASLQKQAGRLGVMKAIEELEDPKYYANEQAPIQNTASPVQNNQNIKLNDKYLK